MTPFCMNPCWVGSDQVQVNLEFGEILSALTFLSKTGGLAGELENKRFKEKKKIQPKSKKSRPKRKYKKQKKKQKLRQNSNVQAHKNHKRRTKESKHMYFYK